MMRVVKRSGETEPLDEGKVKRAILRTGVSEEEANRILEKVKKEFYDGISTSEIYALVRRYLDRRQRARFSMKKAMTELGPEGHNFETLVGRVFECRGYEVLLRQRLKGNCVEHEVDLIVEKEGKKDMIECKFHNSMGSMCRIQDALYTYARFLDLRDAAGISSVWLITNRKFSRDVIDYGVCNGVQLLGWNYPSGRGLERIIEHQRLYPVTALQIKKRMKNQLLEEGFVVLRDLIDREEEVRTLFPREADRLIVMAQEIL